MTDNIHRYKIRLMRVVFFVGVVLGAGKFAAWYLTGSTAILSDALESIINIVAGGMATWGVALAARPKDVEHPYGHGKIEFISAGAEGGLILLSGLYIIYEGIMGFINKPELKALDVGIVITALAGFVNFVMGTILMRAGKKHHSAILIADGKHLLTDTVTSVGVMGGVLLVYLTGKAWIDSVVAIIFALWILYTGYRLVQDSLKTLLDKADYEKLNELIKLFKQHRRPKWVDIHNLRVQKYGSDLHVDCHFTLPWYDTLEESHVEVDYLRDMVQESMPQNVEFFVHADPCVPPHSCTVCILADCAHRKAPFKEQVEWDINNLLPNHKHGIDEREEGSDKNS